MPDEDSHLLDGPPVLRVRFSAFLAQQHQVVPHEVAPSHDLRQVELVLHHLAQSVEVECLMGVILIPRENIFDIGANIDSLSIGKVVSLSGANFFVPGSKFVTASDVADRPEIDEPSPVVPVDHDVHFFEVAVDQLFLCQKQQRHADVFHNLHLSQLGESALAEVVGVVLEIDFAIGEWLLALVVAVVLGDEGAYFVANVFQEVAFVLERDVTVAVRVLEADLFDQAAIFHLFFSGEHLETGMDACLRNIAVNSVNYLCIPSSADYLFFPALFYLY
jgi:hypothetical protein